MYAISFKYKKNDCFIWTMWTFCKHNTQCNLVTHTLMEGLLHNLTKHSIQSNNCNIVAIYSTWRCPMESTSMLFHVLSSVSTPGNRGERLAWQSQYRHSTLFISNILPRYPTVACLDLRASVRDVTPHHVVGKVRLWDMKTGIDCHLENIKHHKWAPKIGQKERQTDRHL